MSSIHGQAVYEKIQQFPVSKKRMWQAWSDAAQLKHWWGPSGCALEILRFEFHPGGFFHYAMQVDGAPPMWGRFNYRELIEAERLVWLNSFANEHCGITRAPFSDVCPLEIENTVTFTEQNGMTTVTLRAQPFGETQDELAFFEELNATGSLEQGYSGTFDKLAAHLAKS